MLFYMVIGGPAVGKTTFRKHLIKFASHKGFEVISYDDVVLERAKRDKTDPQMIYDTVLPLARQMAAHKLKVAVATKRPVIWDTHDTVSAAVRREVLASIPSSYHKIVVVLQPAFNHADRAPTFPWRSGETFEPITTDEGWDEVREQQM